MGNASPGNAARQWARRLAPMGAALALSAFLASTPSLAGEASATFRISVQLMPEGSSACSASTDGGAPRVTCRPTVVGGGATGSGSGDPRGGSTVLGYRIPDTHMKLAKLAGGEMIEVGTENFYAWTEDNSYARGEYSSRLVVAGKVSYVEMTVSW